MLLASLLFALPLQDSLQTLDGQLVRGTIQSATAESVAIKVGSKEATVKASQILRISLGAAHLSAAENYLATFDYTNAAATFEAAAAEESLTGEFAGLRHAETLLAWAHLDAGQARSAAAAFASWLSAHEDSWFHLRGQMGHAQAVGLTGDVDTAATMLEATSTYAFDKNLPVNFGLLARLTRCEVFLTGNQGAVAEARLQRLVPDIEKEIKAPSASPAVRILLSSYLDRGRILLGDSIEQKDGLDSALRYWEELLRRPDLGADARAAATIGQARSVRDAGQARKAQLLLARVVATMPASQEIAARALFALAEVCEELENTPASGKTYYRRLVEDYPSTTWAIKAQEKLGS